MHKTIDDIALTNYFAFPQSLSTILNFGNFSAPFLFYEKGSYEKRV